MLVFTPHTLPCTHTYPPTVTNTSNQQVLEDLLAENDSVLDVWHLLALSYYSGGMIEEAAEVCKSGLQLLQQQQVGPDEGIALAFDDLQSAISEAAGAGAGGAAGGEGGQQS